MLDSAAGSKPHCAVPVKNVDAIEMLIVIVILCQCLSAFLKFDSSKSQKLLHMFCYKK